MMIHDRSGQNLLPDHCLNHIYAGYLNKLTFPFADQLKCKCKSMYVHKFLLKTLLKFTLIYFTKLIFNNFLHASVTNTVFLM